MSPLECSEFLSLASAAEHHRQAGRVVCSAPDRALLAVSGADACDFLQRLLVNDVSALSSGQAQLSALCSPKGRIIALVSVLRVGDEAFYLSCAANLAEILQKRLSMYVLRSRVSLMRQDEMQGARLSLPAEAGKLSLDDRLISIALGEGEYELWGTPESLARLSEQEGVQVAEPDWARWRDIQRNLPVFGAELSENFVPQMVNLDLLDGLSLKKGCFPGQEVVARSHYLGKQKRRMLRLEGPEQAEVPAAGQAVQDSQERDVGQIVAAVRDADGRVQATAVMQLQQMQADDLHLGGLSWRLLESPYEVPLPQ